MATTFKDHCPICGAISLDGRPCEPRCESGNLHHAGIEELPIEQGMLCGDAPDRNPYYGHGRTPSHYA